MIDEQVLDRIVIDMYNKKMFFSGSDGSTVAIKCSTINELFDLLEVSKKLLKTENIIVR